MKPRSMLPVWLLCGVLLGASLAASGAPPPARPAASATRVRAELKAVDAKLGAARAHQVSLQAQVTGLEQDNDAQRELVKQRDAKIAALQRQLAAAGAAQSGGQPGHP